MTNDAKRCDSILDFVIWTSLVIPSLCHFPIPLGPWAIK